MSEQPRLRAVIYCAKSTVDEKDSIGTQLTDCRGLGVDKDVEVVAEYHEENESAYKQSRGPQLAAALAHCERLSAEDGASAFLIPHSDRLARGDGAKEAKHLVEYALWALKHNVTIYSNEDPEMFADGDYGLLMSTIGGMRNHQDSKRKGTSVKAGMLRRAEQRTLPNGGPAGYGFRYKIYIERDPKTGKDVPVRRRIIDPVEAQVVQEIFSRFANEESQSQIGRDLNNRGIRSQRGGIWYQGTLGKLLRCKLVIGRFDFKGKEYEADATEIPQIISLELWDRVQKRLAANVATGAVEQVTQLDKYRQPILDDDGKAITKERAITKGRGRNPRGNFVFVRGMLRCGGCGEAMLPTSKANRNPDGPRYEVYMCHGRKLNGVDFCSQEPVKRAKIDTAVLEFYKRAALDEDGTRATITAGNSRKLSATLALKAQSDRDVAKAQERIGRVKRDYLDGALPIAEWHELREELTADLEASEAKSDRLASQAEAIIAENAKFDAESVYLRNLTALNEQIVGPVKEGARSGADALRAALRGTGIDHFVLVRSGVFYSSRGISTLPSLGEEEVVAGDGGYWDLPPRDDRDDRVYPTADGYVLWPQMLVPELPVDDLTCDLGLRRTALDLSDFDENPLGL